MKPWTVHHWIVTCVLLLFFAFLIPMQHWAEVILKAGLALSALWLIKIAVFKVADAVANCVDTVVVYVLIAAQLALILLGPMHVMLVVSVSGMIAIGLITTLYVGFKAPLRSAGKIRAAICQRNALRIGVVLSLALAWMNVWQLENWFLQQHFVNVLLFVGPSMSVWKIMHRKFNQTEYLKPGERAAWFGPLVALFGVLTLGIAALIAIVPFGGFVNAWLHNSLHLEPMQTVLLFQTVVLIAWSLLFKRSPEKAVP